MTQTPPNAHAETKPEPHDPAGQDLRSALLTLLTAATAMIDRDPELRGALATFARTLLGGASQPPKADAIAPAGPVVTQPAAGAPEEAQTHPAPEPSPPPASPAAAPLLGGAIAGPRVVQAVKLGDARAIIETQGGVVRSIAPILEDAALPPPSPGALQSAARGEERRESEWLWRLPDLRPVAARARLKASAIAAMSTPERSGLWEQWLASRAGRVDSHASHEPPTAADSAPFLGAFDDPANPAVAANAAKAYEALALACDLGTLLRDRDQLKRDNGLSEVFQAMAHAQSCVRSVALLVHADHDRQRNDSEQMSFFAWMRTAVHSDHCATFIRDFFRLEHLAPASDAPEALARISAQLDAWSTRLEHSSRIKKSRDKLQFKLKQLPRMEPQQRAAECLSIEQLLATLADMDIDVHRPPILDYVRSALDAIPPEALAHPFIASVVHAIREGDPAERRRESHDATDAPGQRLRDALAAHAIRRVVVAGGELNPQKRDALRIDLGVEEVIWVEMEKGKSNAGLDGRIRAAAPDLVLCTRWLAHPDEAKVASVADEMGVPYVRLMGQGALGLGPLEHTLLAHLASLPRRKPREATSPS